MRVTIIFMLPSGRYLVTGGTGFIGSALVRALVHQGCSVRILDNHSRGALRRLEGVLDKVEIIEGDIREASVVQKACKGIENVFHLAFINGTEFFYSKPDLVLDVGVRGMLNILDAASAHGVSNFVLASSSEVYQNAAQIPTEETAPLIVPDPLNPRFSYGGGKLISELLALHYAKKIERVTIFRPHNVYGPDMGTEHVVPQFILRLLETKSEEPFAIQGSGKETRAFVYVDDLVAGVLKVLEQGEHRGIYHVGTQEEISIESLAVQIAKAMGRFIRIKTGALTPGSTPRRCPSIAKLQKLGYEPKVSLQEGLSKTIKWYRDNAALLAKEPQHAKNNRSKRNPTLSAT